ncbi:MAG: GLPGLI family protein [Bacteroidales bacterium]|nr:GLPGLI family protein [Bacteroidales bacterium]
MKNIINTIIIIISTVIPLKAQLFNANVEVFDTANLVVMYELSLREDTTHLNYIKNVNQILLIGENGINSYQDYNHYRYYRDMRRKVKDGTINEWLMGGLNVADYISNYQFEIYKNHHNKTISTNDHIFQMGLYEYEETFNSFNWQITSEIDTIHNYVCQKAICDFGGRTWEAWFTMEIPISDGPYKFCGLPGLILNIADTQNHYSFKFLSIEKPSEIINIERTDKDRTKTTKNDFFKLQDKHSNSFSHGVRDMTSNDKAVQRAIEYEMSKNNPIEIIGN